MKIYISLDMEGIPGTYNWEQETQDRAAVKACMFNHLKDIVEAIQSSPHNAAVSEICIADSHMSGDNISYDFTALDPRISLISGGPRPYYMMPAFSDDYDQVWFIGYHAGTGAWKGNMDHSYSNRRIHHIRINGKAMNEALINAAYAGLHGVPVTLVSGDQTLQQELAQPDALPWAQYILTKEAISKFAAKNYSALVLKERTHQMVQQVLAMPKEQFKAFTFKPPVLLEMEFKSSAMADIAAKMPYAKRLDGRTVSFTDNDYDIVFEAIMVLVTLASTVNL